MRATKVTVHPASVIRASDQLAKALYQSNLILYSLDRRATKGRRSVFRNFYVVDGDEIEDVTWHVGVIVGELYDDGDSWVVRGTPWSLPHINETLSQELCDRRVPAITIRRLS